MLQDPESTLRERFFPRLDARFSGVEPTDVNRIRAEVLDACVAASVLAPGLFSLNVPTGGGKTLSSLAFALRHAERYGLSRIIYVIPYMSIIEQNAEVFREFLGDDAVVEHHSSFDPDRDESEDANDEDPSQGATRRRAKLACENWDAPLVATTAVQFFESLFADKPSRCRKLHNLARSVIILDEAQMLPQALLLPCLAAIRELALRYGASVVLCTATQPAVGYREDFKHGLKDVRKIIPDPAALHARLRRTIVQWLGPLSDAALVERLRAHDQALCVVNTKDHARRLYEMLRGQPGLFHLSANMTPAHRSATITKIKETLAGKGPCLVISTSLIECGVCVDFPIVYRATAGLDSIAQAAGRCDREGLLTAAAGGPAGQVFVFTSEDNKPEKLFAINADKAKEIFELGYPDVLAPEAMDHYFRLLFWQAGEELDAKRILRKLELGASKGSFEFRSVAEAFHIIVQDQRPIIVAREEDAVKLVRDLEHVKAPGAILRKLQRHTVQVYPQVWRVLVDAGAVRLVLEGVGVLENLSLYREDLGLCPEDPTYVHEQYLTV